jgi:hypothetical protein
MNAQDAPSKNLCKGVSYQVARACHIKWQGRVISSGKGVSYQVAKNELTH